MAVLVNAKHEKFVQNLIRGMSQRQAYLDAFPSSKKWKEATVDSRACELAKNSKVMGRLAELQAQSASKAILSREERMMILSDIATNIEEPSKPRMQAIDLLNKMTGEYIEKRQVEAVVDAPIEAASMRIKALIDEAKK